jgi:hypothetical protein
MKFRISMKTPDAVAYAIEDAVSAPFSVGDVDIDIENAAAEQKAELEELCKQWFSYGENVTIEIDTETKTATVLKTRG